MNSDLANFSLQSRGDLSIALEVFYSCPSKEGGCDLRFAHFPALIIQAPTRVRRHMSAVVTTFAFLTICGTAFAAFHDYHDDYFFAVGDAFIFRGGREGLFASSAEVRSAMTFVVPDEQSAAAFGSMLYCNANRRAKIGQTLGKLHLEFPMASLRLG